MSRFIKKHSELLNDNLGEIFSDEAIEKLAKETGFVKRKSTITGKKFLELLMFNSQQGTLTSLDYMASDFRATHGLSVSKQTLDERFNSRSVLFLKKVLSSMLTKQYEGVLSRKKEHSITSCRVRDSTRFKLPDKYGNVYKGQEAHIHKIRKLNCSLA